MLEDLLHINPALYNDLISRLNEACIELEPKYRMPKNSLGFRPIRPDDNCIGGTRDKYSYMFHNDTKSNAFIGGLEEVYTTVPTCNAWFYFGWKCKLDLGANGYVAVVREGVVISKIQAPIVYEQQYPQHTYYDIPNIQFFTEQSRVQFFVCNKSGLDKKGEVFPILYRIATKPALNILKKQQDFNWDEISRNMVEAVKEQESKIKLTKIESILSEIKDNFTPFEYVDIKDSPFTSHKELKSRLDPSMKNYLENLKQGKVCKFCGELIYGDSIYCFACGCPINNTQEKEKLYNELDKKV